MNFIALSLRYPAEKKNDHSPNHEAELLSNVTSPLAFNNAAITNVGKAMVIPRSSKMRFFAEVAKI